MSIKERKEDLFINKLEILISRLPKSLPQLQTISNDLIRLHNHLHLKRKTDYYLQLLPKKFIIFKDLHLKNIQLFQLDTLVITPYAIFIIQIENIDNELIEPFQTVNDYIRRTKNAQINLYKWLQKRNFNSIPIYYITVICNLLYQMIKKDEHISKSFSIAKHLPAKLTHFYNYIKQIHHKNKRLMKQIAHEIYVNKQHYELNLLDHYKINRNLIKTGVRCHKCLQLRMKWINNTWICLDCKIKTKFAHIDALNDYFTLLQNSICVHDCQWFLNIDNVATAKQLLNDETLTYNNKQEKWAK